MDIGKSFGYVFEDDRWITKILIAAAILLVGFLFSWLLAIPLILALVLDVDIAGDVPGIEPHQAPAKMSEGVAITVFDASMIPNQALKDMVIGICDRNKIPYQLTHVAMGGTDGGPIHTSNIGTPSIAIGVPTRHIHSHVGVIDTADIDWTLRLVIELVKALDGKAVSALTSG